MTRFTLPRDTYFGENSLDYLKTIKGSRAMIVIGSQRLIQDGTIPKIQALLKEAGVDSEIFSGVEPDPSIATVNKGVEAMNKYQPDWIISVGGGSPIDAAKAMWIFYEYPQFTFQEAAQPFNLPELRQKAKFIAIPTTSGTGTEVTAFSVITDNETGIKYPIADFNITPDVAIVDPALVTGMSDTLTADTGMDALTHAIEAYVSTGANPITDGLAIKAIQMVMDDLVPSFKGDAKARGNMHIAQCIAGMAFSVASLGIVHSMAHKTGHIFGITHGRSNAIYLTYVTQFNAKTAASRYADIARAIGLTGADDNALTAALVQRIKQLRAELGIPSSLGEYGTDEKLFGEKLESISKTALGDPCTFTNPRPVSQEEMEKIFQCIYNGTDVAF